jgi:NTP-dependent ternary conflict system VMAP-like protein/effector-associated domain 2 (EAD2)-containing protein
VSNQDDARLLDIAAALTEISALQEENGRAQFVTMLGRLLGSPLNVPFNASPQVYLLNVVMASLDRPRGTEVLLTVAEFFAGKTFVAAEVRRLLSPARDHFDASAEERISRLLSNWRPAMLTRIYHLAAGDTLTPPPTDLGDAWQAFTLLREMNAAPDGLARHLVFLAHLIKVLRRQLAAAENQAAATRAAELTAWLDEQVALLRAQGGAEAADRLERIRRDADTLSGPPQLPLFLVMQLERVEEMTDGEPLYRLCHWRQLHPLNWSPQPGEDEVLPLAKVEQRVGELVREAEIDWAYGFDEPLVLEFVLPVELLNLAVEEWTRYGIDEDDPLTLGVEYEIAVRSLERLYAKDHHRAWRRRWGVLVSDGEGGTTHWIGEHEPADPGRLRYELEIHWEVVACVLSTAPDREPGLTEVRMALRAGVPILLWHRGKGFSPDCRTALRNATARPHPRLPAVVRKLRGQARSRVDPDPEGAQRLAVLCDDPRRFLDGVRPLRTPRI